MLPLRPNLSARPYFLAEVPQGALPDAKRRTTSPSPTPQAAAAPVTPAPPLEAAGAAPTVLGLFLAQATALLGQAESLLGTAHEAALTTLGQLYVTLTDGVDAVYRQGLAAIESMRRNLDLKA